MGNGLQPVYDGLDELSEPGGFFPCECGEEPGIGEGVPGKIAMDLFTHVNPDDIGPRCCESASVMCFGTGTKVMARLRREPLIGIERLLLDLMEEFMAGPL